MTTHTIWKTELIIEDNFFPRQQHEELINLNVEATGVVKGMDHTWFQAQFPLQYTMINAMAIEYATCIGADFNNLELSNVQFGFTISYKEKHVHSHLYEPHHDLVEQSYVSAIYYIDSSFTETGDWVGGELCIYNNLTYAEYPNNAVNIRPVSNRLILFPGFLVHRVKPYFGDKPRRTIVFGWKVLDQPTDQPTIF